MAKTRAQLDAEIAEVLATGQPTYDWRKAYGAPKRVRMPRYNATHGWTGGDSKTLYTFTDKRTGYITVKPGGTFYVKTVGPEHTVRVATRDEAEAKWQSPLHAGWNVNGDTGARSPGRRR
jgi:hypothetical protein